jgi:hypothetical protein
MLRRYCSSLAVAVCLFGCSSTGGSAAGAAGAAGVTATGGNTAAGSAGDTAGGGNTSVGLAGGGSSAGSVNAAGTGGAAGSGGSGGSVGEAGKNAGGAMAGSAGSGQAGSASMACPAAALFCDDFEDGNLDGWKKLESGGTLLVDMVQHAGGTHSLLVDIPANQRGGFLERSGAPLFPLPNKLLWGRAMVYFDTTVDGHTDVIRGAGAGGNIPQYNIGEQHEEILINYYNGPTQDCWARPKPGKVVPLKTWMCWEWSFDGNANELQFFIDGQLSRKVSQTGDGCGQGNATWVAPDFASFRIGQYIAQVSATPTKLWIDDIAVGTTARLGCPAP